MKIILVALSILILSACERGNERGVLTQQRVIRENVNCKTEYLTRMTEVIEYKHNGNIYLVFRGPDCIFVIKEEIK